MKKGKQKPKLSTEDFRRRVYEVVAEIPEGRVTTYGAIAASLGFNRSARLVGYALRVVPDDLPLPCHRVVNRNGELSGQHNFATSSLMRDLLESEGVTFIDDVVNMPAHFWNPEG